MGHDIETLRKEFANIWEVLVRHKLEEVFITTHSVHGYEESCEGKLHRVLDDCFYDEDFNGYHYACGATRICIWDDNERDYVFKFGYDKYDLIDGLEYNENERDAYKAAQAEGYDDSFAWCDIIDTYTINGYAVNILAMEYCDVNNDRTEDIIFDKNLHTYCEKRGLDFNEVKKDQEALEGYYDSIYYYCPDDGDEEVRDYMGSLYGYDLLNFLDAHEIHDVHCGNVGFNRHNRMVFTDYASYGNCFVA